MSDMRRREFVTLLGGAAAAWPLAARAQQPDRIRRIGVLVAYAESDRTGQAFVAAFREGLQKLGWTEGRNVRIETRWAAADGEAMQRFAKELVAQQPDLLLTQNTPTTAAMLQQTRSIPIVFANVSDPIGSSFVVGFPSPGGNVTGFVVAEPTMAGKWLELLKEIAPRVARVAMLFNPVSATFAEYWLNPRRCLLCGGGDPGTCSRHVRARTGHCRPGTRAEWWHCRNAGCLRERPSRGDHLAGCSLPSPCRLSVPFFR
jgi:putative ABC transport system substrate-binding protein